MSGKNRMQNMIRKIIVTMISLLILISLSLQVVFGETADELFRGVSNPETASIENSKDGIVEIQTGVVDEQDRFKRIKSGSGFLISNSADGVYIVTSSHNTHLTKDERRKVGDNKSVSIRVVVRGDVSAQLTVIADSRRQDFCILESEKVINEKMPIGIEDESGVNEGEPVTAMGFSNKKRKDKKARYDTEDVECAEYDVTYLTENVDGIPVVIGKKKLDKGFDGGPLLNRSGYVCGVINHKFNDDNSDGHGALQINELVEVLDNYGLNYRSKIADLLYAHVYDLCREGSEQVKDPKYKSDSRENMSSALEYGLEVLREAPYDKTKLAESESLLLKAQKSLERKTPKIIWIIVALAIAVTLEGRRCIKLYKWRNDNADFLVEERVSTIAENVPDYEDSKCAETENKYADNTLSYDKRPEATLVWNNNNCNIAITHRRFVIGKKKDEVDLSISSNPAISRKHAMITWDNGRYYISDMGSSNGTFVNEEKVKKHILKSGDLIRLADEEFIFLI